jgi:hypothetical protein
VQITNSSFLFCVSKVLSGFSNEALSLGGALSIVYDSYIYPKQIWNTPLPFFQFFRVNVAHCNFSQSSSFSVSSSCIPGAQNAGGGAVFVSALNADLMISSSVFFNASVSNECAAPASETYSLGGGLSVFQAGNVIINATNFTRCFARGIRQSTNVFVSGGGLFIQNSTSVTLKSSAIAASGVLDASFTAGVLASPCGGGAMGTRDVFAVRISDCTFHNNSDSCLTGVVFLQQLILGKHLTVDIANKSVISTDPSISVALPVLNISCGSNCSFEQQKRLRLNVMDSTIRAHNQAQQSHESALVMSLPRMLRLFAENSFVNCSFTGDNNTAVLVIRSSAIGSVSVSCAPCTRPFTIAMTSRSMSLSNFSAFESQTMSADSCRTLNLTDSRSDIDQQCPFGFSFCSTITNVAVGFWANFSSDGSIGNAVRCPQNYCGCRNIPGYSQPSCQLFPPFAVEFRPDDALCNGNRSGVLCGGCRLNFTQSLNGFSCVHNDVCLQTMPWIWTITVLGFIAFSIYIVVTSMNINSGLIMCVMFYGQLSSFASVPPQFDDAAQSSSWVSKVSQFDSIVSFYDSSCYGVNMGAYDAAAAQLCGPAIVVAVSIVLTAAAKRLQRRFTHFLQKRKISLGATLVNVLLLLYSSVSSVVFQLITCQEVGTQRVVFIDGRYPCEGSLYSVLIAVAAVLSIIPVVFWAMLRFDKIPEPVKSAVCSAYTDSEYYWGALSLLVRFVMTVVSATAREFPSITALALLICSLCMFGLLIMLRPYAQQRTYYMDIFCYACLIVQFALQSIVRNSESLGVAVAASNSFRPTLVLAARSSNVLR